MKYLFTSLNVEPQFSILHCIVGAHNNKKLVRFLQYHDQKTEGIPGLFPLYQGLQIRVTEKIKKSKKLIILKHASGTVVGWQVHAGDQILDSSCQRVLRYLPKVIFARIHDATWQLAGLPEGVYPMSPVERVWTLNKETGAKYHERVS